MKKTERLFHLVERLRSAQRPMTAETLASELEVSERTIYRDVKLLMLQGLPIEGEAGVGYVISRDFNAPALQFTRDELEILSIGLRMVYRDGDGQQELIYCWWHCDDDSDRPEKSRSGSRCEEEIRAVRE